MEKHDQLLMKKQNKLLVLEIIKNKSPISRMDISKLTKMSPTSISRIVGELYQRGFVKETELVTNGVGRKATLLNVCDDVLFTIGVEIDKTVIKIGIVNYVGKIINFQTHLRNSLESYAETLHHIHQHVKSIIEQNSISIEKVMGLAIGLPGSIDHNKGIVRLSDQLQWENVNLAQDLKELTSLDVVIDNELKMKVIAENTLGKAKDSQNSILVGIGSGIGSAIILNGEVYRGESNNAGEIGHTVVDPNGNVCNCGKVGCLATYISEGAILADCRKVKDISSIEDVFTAFKNKESWALNILDRTITQIALAISNLACLYNPEVIILSGDLFDKLPLIKQYIEEKCERYMWEPIKETLRIVYSNLGDQGVVLGAAIQAQTTLFNLN
jgi:N-acetylglucosamine repressor